MFGLSSSTGGLNHKLRSTVWCKTTLRPIGPMMIRKRSNVFWKWETYSFQPLVSMSITQFHIVRPLRQCGTLWKLLTRVPRTSNNQNSILSSNNMSSFTWRMVKPSPSMQVRFTHIINKLQNLRKDISNQDCIDKMLRCMTGDWPSKVTAIEES